MERYGQKWKGETIRDGWPLKETEAQSEMKGHRKRQGALSEIGVQKNVGAWREMLAKTQPDSEERAETDFLCLNSPMQQSQGHSRR